MIFRRLRRVTSGQFIPEIDGLRFLAIMPVVFMHTATSFKKNSLFYNQATLKDQNLVNDIINTGSLGVYLFFVISGFILSLPFLKQHRYQGKRVSLTRYFKKRLTRLEPPYLITLSLLFIGQLWLGSSDKYNLFKHYVANFFYSHNIIYDSWSPINPVTWSLEVEIQFYILVPVLTLLFLIKQSYPRRIILLIVIIFFSWLNHFYKFPFGILPSYIQYFLTGFFLADLYLEPIRNKITTKGVDLLGLLAIVSIFFIEYHKARYLFPLSFSIIFWAAFKGKALQIFFSTPWVTTIGGMCYITYLIHFPLTFILTKFTKNLASGQYYELDLLVQYVIVIPLTLLISALAFLLLEKPFMYPDWHKHSWLFLRKKVKDNSAK